MTFINNPANCISFLRIILSLLLLFTRPLSSLFFIIFIFCGISDVFDGYIARKYDLTTDFGANLDSFADIILFFCFLIVLLPTLKLNLWVIFWIMGIVLIKIFSIIFGFIKFGEFSLIHTYLNKITGVFLMFLPFLLLIMPSDVILDLLCLIATVASMEELFIIVSSQKLNLNRKSIFKK